MLTTQKKYGTYAASIYWDRIKKSVDCDTKLVHGDLPDYDTGRLPYNLV